MEDGGVGRGKKWFWSEKKISVSSGSLCPSMMINRPHLPKDGEEAVTAWGEGCDERKGVGGMRLPLSTHDSKMRRERGVGEGVGKRQPKQTS